MTTAYNMDCMEAMRTFPDKFFDLAVVDPPYGAGFTEGGGCKGWFAKYHQDTPVISGGGQYWERFGGRFDKYRGSDRRDLGEKVRKKIIAWDTAPGEDYFKELFRVSRNQIIWGGNYFALPPTRCFLVWRKTNIPETFTMAMAEYAWTSFADNAKVIDLSSAGQTDRFHPTQKPVALYAWIFAKYAKPGYKILDTHLGSGSSRIAAYDAGLDFWGYEIDKEYFDKQEERFAIHTAQMDMFH